MLLPRRRILGGALGLLGVASLGGCALVPPAGSPVAPLPVPTPDLTAAHRALLGLHARLAAVDTPPPALRWCLGVVDEQLAALGLTAPPPSTAPPSVKVVRAALGDATSLLRERALDPRTADPLAWASIAAWSRGAADALGRTAPQLEAARTRLSPAPATPAVALGALLTTADQVRFALEVAGGTPGLSTGRADAVRDRLRDWALLRRDVAAALAALPEATVPPAEPVWQVQRPADPDAARALVARTEAAALPPLGRAVAAGPDAVRPALVDALVAGAAVLPAWGATLPRWPGYPA